MATCFVIQPFDNGPFDKRYDDVFVPAIAAAGIEAYRVDRDPEAAIPIEEVENGIRRADICLADISMANPNVWFEVGYAIASAKPLVMVCSHDPARRYPFDIQHRTVIAYRTESARDFEELEQSITTRIRATLAKQAKLDRIAESTVAGLEGLNTIEIATLATVGSNVDGPLDTVSSWSIRQDMEKSGYTRIASTLGLTSLLQKGMLSCERETDINGEDYSVYTVTSQGFDWLFENQERLVLHETRRPPKAPDYSGLGVDDDDVPF